MYRKKRKLLNKKIIKIFILNFLLFQILISSGCLAMVVGGAAGTAGYYIGKGKNKDK